jgi:penicillin-binding protein 2
MYLESPPPRPEPQPDRLPLALRATALGLVAVGLMGVLLFRLWALQVLHSDQAAVAAVQNQLRMTPLPAARGTVVDRNGSPLVVNKAALVVQINPATLPKPVDCKTIRPGHRAALAREPGCMVMYRLADVLKAKFLSVVRQYQRGQTMSFGYPVTLKQRVTKTMVMYVKERMPEFRGVQFAQAFQRQYPKGALAANVLGSVGRVGKEDLPGGSQHRFYTGENLDPNGTVGKSGVEQIYDRYLRGTDGKIAQSFDAAGFPVGRPYLVRAPGSGDKLQLTIDASLQKAAQQAITYGISVAHSDGQYYANRGAIVAMNPDTGAIFALASWPTYNPKIWVPPYDGQRDVLKRAKAANANRHIASPLVDMAAGAGFPAGSTFKPFTAIAAWMQGIIGAGSVLPCTTSYQSPYDQSHHPFNNWGPINATIGLSKALEISCDTFFYRLGNAFYGDFVGNQHREKFQFWLRQLGFGSPPAGFDLLSTAGLVPTERWKETYPCFQQSTPNLCKGFPALNENQALIAKTWEPGDDITMAIGQSYLLVSPLQEAIAYSALANGGKIMAPHVVKAVVDPSTDQPVRQVQPQVVRNLHLPPELLSQIQTGLYGATHAADGTSSSVFAPYTGHPFTVYGKTGTAEVPNDCATCNDAWWSGWATNGHKRLVVVAMIQDGGHGGVAAAPAALRVFESFFRTKLTAVTGQDASR